MPLYSEKAIMTARTRWEDLPDGTMRCDEIKRSGVKNNAYGCSEVTLKGNFTKDNTIVPAHIDCPVLYHWLAGCLTEK